MIQNLYRPLKNVKTFTLIHLTLYLDPTTIPFFRDHLFELLFLKSQFRKITILDLYSIMKIEFDVRVPEVKRLNQLF